jgi:hypothetical protein
MVKSREPEKCFTLVGTSLTHKYKTILERIVQDKTNLLLKMLNKMIYNYQYLQACANRCYTLKNIKNF